MNTDPITKTKPLGLIGLGLVGTSLAKRFIDAGFRVIGFDIDYTYPFSSISRVEISNKVWNRFEFICQSVNPIPNLSLRFSQDKIK